MAGIDEILIKSVRQDDDLAVNGLAKLFNSDSMYHDPFFNTPELIKSRLPARNPLSTDPADQDRMKVALVAVHDGKIVGFAGAGEHYLTELDRTGASAKVAEGKKLFVHPEYRGALGSVSGARISDRLRETRKKVLIAAGYDALFGSAVSGHPGSQVLYDNSLLVGFAPLWASNEFTRSGQRESMLLTMTYLGKQLEDTARSRKEVHIPEAAADFARQLCRVIGVSRDIVTHGAVPREKEMDDAMREYVKMLERDEGDANLREVLPERFMNVSQPPKGFSRVQLALERGWVPTGMAALGADRVRMQYVPKGSAMFEPQKVRVIPAAQPLVKLVGEAYNTRAARA